MKAVLIPLLLVAAVAFSQEPEGIPIPREQAASLKTVDPEEITKSGPAKMEGKLIKLRFNCRGESYEPVSGIDEYRSRVGFFRSAYGFAGGTERYGTLDVRFPHNALDWFLKLPTDTGARKTTVVIARVTPSKLNGRLEAEILGREIRTDSKGPKVIW